MNIIYANPPPNHPIPVRKVEKASTTQLKHALEKIKQTQLQVLKVLRSESETSNLTQTQIRVMSQNIESITNVNLMKIAEMSEMRKELDSQKKKSGETVTNLHHILQAQQKEIAMRKGIQAKLNHQKQALIEKINSNADKNSNINRTNSEEIIRKMTINFEQEISQKMKQRATLESQVRDLQQRVRELSQENEQVKGQLNEKGDENEELSKRLNEYRVNKSQTLNLSCDNLILEIKKISSNHQKIYSNLKIRSRVTISDLDTEQEIQQSFSKILKYIQTSQRSNVDLGKLPDSTYLNQIRTGENEIADEEVMVRSFTDLRMENSQLKEDKDSLNRYTRDLEQKLKDYQSQGAKVERGNSGGQIKEYLTIVEGLKQQMQRIRIEKQDLNALVKKFGETPIKTHSQQSGFKILREQLDQIIAVNVELRKQNDGLKVMMEGLKLQIDSLKAEQRTLQNKLEDTSIALQRQVRQKESMAQNVSKYAKIAEQKERNHMKQQAKIGQLQSSSQASMGRFQLQRKAKMDQMLAIRKDQDRLLKQNRDLREVAYRLQILEGQNGQLRQKLMHLNSTIIHLWQIKQAQYSNIHSIFENLPR